MPKPKASDFDLAALRDMLRRQGGLDHLAVRKYGAHLILESQDKDASCKHARFTAVSAQFWTLGLPDHRGKWERTPYRGTLREMLDLTLTSFPWMLAPQSQDWGDTSGPRH